MAHYEPNGRYALVGDSASRRLAHLSSLLGPVRVRRVLSGDGVFPAEVAISSRVLRRRRSGRRQSCRVPRQRCINGLPGSANLSSVGRMGRYVTQCAPERDADRGEPPGTSASDDGWTAELRAACGCSALLLGLLLLIDVGSGRLTGLRALMWVALAVLLLVVLVPPRVTAGEGWLASRSLLRRRRVRTDSLVGVRTALVLVKRE